MGDKEVGLPKGCGILNLSLSEGIDYVRFMDFQMILFALGGEDLDISLLDGGKTVRVVGDNGVLLQLGDDFYNLKDPAVQKKLAAGVAKLQSSVRDKLSDMRLDGKPCSKGDLAE